MSSCEDYAVMVSVPEWYAGKNVFITGATGFMGKVLVEKLLRDCPDVNCLYLLIRPKKGMDPDTRKKEYLKSEAFKDLLEKNPLISDKVKVIKGDVLEEDLGISENDRNELISKINIVFHCAANVRFDQELKGALEMNLGGTLRMMKLAEKITNLKVFVHVSTTYCHCKEDILEERAYPAPNDPLAILQMVRSLDDKFLEKITPQLLNGLPNTYSYSKALSEGLVNSYGSKLPLVICRPPIVTAALKEPIPGWVEGVTGPTGLVIGAARGVIRTMHCNPDYLADTMPVDLAINAIIVAAWDRAHKKLDQTDYFNVVLPSKSLMTWGESLETGKRIFYENPLCFSLWYPDGSIKKNYYHHMISLFFFHLLPAYFIDGLLFLLGQKRFMVRVQKKVSMGLKVLQYYTTKPWVFKNDRLEKLRVKLNMEDQDIFNFTMEMVNNEEYIYNYIMVIRKYILKEGTETLPRARIILRRLYIIDRIVKLLFWTLAFWILWTNMELIVNYAESLFGITTKFFTTQGRFVLETM